MYKLSQKNFDGNTTSVINLHLVCAIPFDPANTDYQQFKAQINADEAQLEYADGNLMTAKQAKDFIATLP